MTQKGILRKIKDVFHTMQGAAKTKPADNAQNGEGVNTPPTYEKVQSGELSYEEAVLRLADDMCWILNTAYQAAYPDVYIKGALKSFVSPVKELAFASTFLVLTSDYCADFQEASGRDISLYDLVLEGEGFAGHPLLKDATWREPFYRFAADLAREGCLARRTFETEEEYDSLFHYIGECIRMYAVKHPVDANGVPLEYIQEKGDPNGIAAAVVDAGRVSSEVRGETDNETELTESVNSSRESHRHTCDNDTLLEEAINENIDENDFRECALNIPEDPFF